MNRTFRALMILVLLGSLALPLSSPRPVAADPHPLQSQHVAYIDSLDTIKGGEFPTTTSGPTGTFLDFSFHRLPVASVTLAALGPGGVCGTSACDTVLLNVGSSGMYCDVNSLTEQQKADLVTFVNQGNKLIIYDSECLPQDYSWLPYPFTTVNPGALGARGTLSYIEENTLSSDDPANVHYIDADLLGSESDAVGDMNVMTTYHSEWYLDMTGTNTLDVTGPVHTYAALPEGTLPFGEDAGLIIYNGLDVDYLRSYTAPDSSTAAGNLAKIWLQELQQEFNPSRLPGENPVCGLSLAPEIAEAFVGDSHTAVATLTDLEGNPQPGIAVSFSVDPGPNTGTEGECTVNSDCTADTEGKVSFTYVGDGGEGTDVLWARTTDSYGQVICEASANVEWQMRCTPEDMLYSLQWDMEKIDLAGALSQFTNCQPDPVSIAVIDTGVDINKREYHQDLDDGRIVDTDSSVGSTAEDRNGHGTNVAGIIGAMQNNELGIAGVHPSPVLRIYKYSNKWENWLAYVERYAKALLLTNDHEDVADFIKQAVDDGARVINVSLGAEYDRLPSTLLEPIGAKCYPHNYSNHSCGGVLEEAIKYAAQQDPQVIIVAAAGQTDPNPGRAGYSYPAAYAAWYPNVIAVVSSTPSNTFADRWVIWGDYITIAAPGGADTVCDVLSDDCIWTLGLDNGSEEKQGTSMAAPHVTGVVALMLSARSNLTPEQIRSILACSATDFSEPTTLLPDTVGILNASEAVRRAFEGDFDCP